MSASPVNLSTWNQSFTVSMTWSLKGAAAPGDYFTYTYPTTNVSYGSAQYFPLLSPDGLTIACGSLINGVLTVELTDYAVTHGDVHGSLHFSANLRRSYVAETRVDFPPAGWGGELYVIAPPTLPTATVDGGTTPGRKSGTWTDPNQGAYYGENVMGWTIQLPSRPAGYTNVVISDPVPAGQTWWYSCEAVGGLPAPVYIAGWTVPTNYTYTCDSSGITVTIPSLPGGTVRSIIVYASIPVGAPGPFSNSASFTADGVGAQQFNATLQRTGPSAGGDGNGNTPTPDPNATVTATPTPTPPAPPTVTKTVSQSVVAPGSQVTWVMQVSGRAAPGSIVTYADNLPAGITGVTILCSPTGTDQVGACDTDASDNAINGTIKVGASSQYGILYQATATIPADTGSGEVFPNEICAHVTTQDVPTAQRCADASVSTIELPGVSGISKSADPSQAAPGSVVTFSVPVTWKGTDYPTPFSATAILFDYFPSGYAESGSITVSCTNAVNMACDSTQTAAFEGQDPGDGSLADGGLYYVDIPDATQDGSITLILTMTVANTAETGTLTNTACHSVTIYDLPPGVGGLAPAGCATADVAIREVAPTATTEPTATATATTEPTATATTEPTATATETTEPTATATGTTEPTATATETTEPTATATETTEPTATATATGTTEPTPTATGEPSSTATATLQPTETATVEPTVTGTIAPTSTITPDPTTTATVEPTATTGSTIEPTLPVTVTPDPGMPTATVGVPTKPAMPSVTPVKTVAVSTLPTTGLGDSGPGTPAAVWMAAAIAGVLMTLAGLATIRRRRID